MSQWTDKHKSDLKLLLEPHSKSIAAKLPTYGDAFVKRVTTDVQHAAEGFINQVEAIKSSGRYSPVGVKTELRLAARAFKEQLRQLRTDTVTKLDQQLTEQRKALVKPKTPHEPLDAILTEMRHREYRDHLRTLDPLQLQQRIRQATTDETDLLDALDGAPSGFPIAPPSLIHEARTRIAEANHPELGHTAQLRDAYSYSIGIAEQLIPTATGLTPVEITTDPTPTPREPIPARIASTGQAVKVS